MENKWIKILYKALSYVLVAMVTACVTFLLCLPKSEYLKLTQLQELIATRFVGTVTDTQLTDGAAQGMVGATGDRWSYYIPATEFESYQQQMNNQYVGIGAIVANTITDKGLEIIRLEENGGAKAAGLQVGDYIYQVDGELVKDLGNDGTRSKIAGEADTQVRITVMRGEESLTFTVTRTVILVEVAKGQMLGADIGYIRIANFDERCADETIKAIQTLMEQGATKMIFDVRNNPGGYKRELTKILDYLLPEGEIFRAVDYSGKEEITTSDASCVELEMVILVNRDSYSAAEFFAAALQEYEKAVVLGEQTVGKGYFQETYRLADGSAVGLSVGKYYTPKGISLAEAGGLTPDVPVEVDEKTYQEISAQVLPLENDPQVCAAVQRMSE